MGLIKDLLTKPKLVINADTLKMERQKAIISNSNLAVTEITTKAYQAAQTGDYYILIQFASLEDADGVAMFKAFYTHDLRVNVKDVFKKLEDRGFKVTKVENNYLYHRVSW